ncbi:FeoA family protein [Orbaceae bacterium ac157xtp]
MDTTPLTLNKLPFGKEAVITKLLPAAAPYRRKLLAMGITPGATVSVVRVAPMGDPLEIKMRGFFLCLRRTEAATIAVVEAAK